MKLLVVSLLALTLIFDVFSFIIWDPTNVTRDYENIVGYVRNVEKDGFNQKEFSKFAAERNTNVPSLLDYTGRFETVD